MSTSYSVPFDPPGLSIGGVVHHSSCTHIPSALSLESGRRPSSFHAPYGYYHISPPSPLSTKGIFQSRFTWMMEALDHLSRCSLRFCWVWVKITSVYFLYINSMKSEVYKSSLPKKNLQCNRSAAKSDNTVLYVRLVVKSFPSVCKRQLTNELLVQQTGWAVQELPETPMTVIGEQLTINQVKLSIQ